MRTDSAKVIRSSAGSRRVQFITQCEKARSIGSRKQKISGTSGFQARIRSSAPGQKRYDGVASTPIVAFERAERRATW